MAQSTHTKSDVVADTHATVAVEEAHHEPSPMDVSPKMMGWTWLTFGIVALVLYKLAWKPILQGLDDREEKIRKSIEDAEKIQQSMNELDAKRQEQIAEADSKAKKIVVDARKAAVEAAGVIEAKARSQAEIMSENAAREIKSAQEKAQVALREEAAELAVSLASKILHEELNAERQKALTAELIKDL